MFQGNSDFEISGLAKTSNVETLQQSDSLVRWRQLSCLGGGGGCGLNRQWHNESSNQSQSSDNSNCGVAIFKMGWGWSFKIEDLKQQHS